MTKQALDQKALDQLFLAARSYNWFTDRPVSDDALRALYELSKWGPTSQNTQPARYVFVRTQGGKEKLRPALIATNVEKTMSAPVTVIIAIDSRFYDHLPTQFRAYDAKPAYENNATLAQTAAFRNATLQGAYLMLAVRALGLDCGAMSGFDAAKIDAAFFPDGQWRANFLINLGYGDSAGNYPPAPRLSFDTVAIFA